MLETTYKFGEVNKLASRHEDAATRVNFKNIFSTTNGGVSVLTFRAGQKLDEHTAPTNVMVYVMSGAIEFIMAGKAHTISAGEFLLMGQDVRHRVTALSDAEVMLVKIKS